MQLKHISIPHLIAEAGGDPWAINKSLQSGRPAQISDLAQAFHNAGQSTNEADTTFNEALRRFQASWNRENGENPINDAAEVQRATQTLGVQAAQLPKVAADLENVAAGLAEAQRSAAGQIAMLEGQLESIDNQLDELLQLEKNGHLSLAEEMALNDMITGLEDQAIGDTKSTLHQVEHIRDQYSEQLQHSMTNLRGQDGYDPSLIQGLDGHEPETPEQAEKDVQGALGGNQAAASRLNAVLDSITADQRAGKVPLTAEQASVLSQLQAQEHGMSIDALKAAEQRLGDQKDLIGNSWQLMSNPNITFPQTPFKIGATQVSDTVKGGATQLPESVQQALNSPGVLYTDQMNTIAGIVKDGNPAFQTNTELDRGMIRKASTMMNAPIWQQDPASNGQNVGRDPALDPAVSNVLSAVSADHQVVHDTMTGPDHDNFLRNVTHHFWSDNGRGVQSLFSWTEAAAQGPEAQIAAETAHAYSSYIGTHNGELLHLPGNHTLGQVNPDLVQGMAHGLTPYINNIADTSGGLPGFGALDGVSDIESGKLPIAKGIFSVLNTDHDAGQYFNSKAYAQAVLHETAFAQDPTHSGYNDQLFDAATLRGLVDVGTHNAYQANEDNGCHQQVSEYDSKKSAYELGVKGLSTAGGFIPGVGKFGGPAIGIVGSSLENDILGPAPSAPTESPVQPMSIGAADHEILDAMLASGHPVNGLPDGFIIYDHDHPHGRIATFAEMQQKGVTAGQYNNVIGPALSHALAPRPPDEEMSPDQYMTDRYDDVIGVPHPPTS
jgi:hypothetical protein